MKNRTSSNSSRSKFPFLTESPKGVFISVRLQPRSSRNAIDGVQGDSLKIRLTSPPVEGEANKALIEFLSKLIGIKKSSLEIDIGLKSRDKRVRVEGADLKELEKVFLEALGKS